MLTILCILLSESPLEAQTASEEAVFSRMQVSLDSLNRTEGFSGNIGLYRHGKLLWLGQQGLLENPSPENAAQLGFHIASISKTFVSAAVLKAVSEGKLSLDDKLVDYFPEFVWPGSENIRIRNLLNHTSGLVDYINDKPLWFGVKSFLGWKPNPPELRSKIARWPLNFDPEDGEEGASYSNSGYVLLAQILEQIYEKPYQEVVREKVIEPAGLRQTSFERPEGRSRLEAYGGKFYRKKPQKELPRELTYGMGEMVSSASDLAQWGHWFWEGGLLDSAHLAMIFDSTNIANDLEDETLYGLGWEKGIILGNQYVGHSGYIPGWTSYLLHFPDDSLSLVFLSNFDGVDPLPMVANLLINYWNNTTDPIFKNMADVPDSRFSGDYFTSRKKLRESGLSDFFYRMRVHEENGELVWQYPFLDVEMRFQPTAYGKWEGEDGISIEMNELGDLELRVAEDFLTYTRY